FNKTFLNKWAVYQALSRNSKIIPYLPKTKLFQNQLVLKGMMQAYPVLLIKPIHGAMGRGIFRLSRSWTGYELQYSATEGQQRKQFANLNRVFSFLKNKVKSRKFILQEGIPIIHLQDRAID